VGDDPDGGMSARAPITGLTLHPVSAARETGFVSYHVILRLEAGEHVGWGELSDLGHLPMYSLDVPQLERTLQGLLLGRDAFAIAAIEDLLIRCFPDEGHMYSRSGLVRQGVDLALHDLVGRATGRSVAEVLGGALRDRVPVCYPIFRLRSEDEVAINLDRVADRLAEGFDLFRLYVGVAPEADVRFLAELRSRFGDAVAIKSLDFSNRLPWREALALTERYAEVASFELVESVAPRQDLEGLAAFRGRSAWPVSEHVCSLSHAWQLLRAPAVDILNVSPYVLGGLRPCLRVAHLAEAANAGVLIGTTQELSVGTAAVAHLGAALRVLTHPCDNVGPRLYATDVVREPVRYEAGSLLVPDGPGLGVEVDPEALERHHGVLDWSTAASPDLVADRTSVG
jgi:muconate cycloisomerase